MHPSSDPREWSSLPRETDPDWPNGELLGFDLETTGTDPFEALPVSFALVSYESGKMNHSTYRLVNPGISIPPDSIAVHHITDDMVLAGGMPLGEAIDYCREALCVASASNVPVVGMVLRYDLTIVDRLHRARGNDGLRAPHWSGPALDVSLIDKRLDKWRKGKRTLHDLCAVYSVALEEGAAHDAAADAVAAVEVLFAQTRLYPVLGHTDLATLTRRQAEIHRAFLVDLNEYRLRLGGVPIPDSEIEGGWPVATQDSIETLAEDFSDSRSLVIPKESQ